MENDDKQMGRILSRRDVLKLLGITSASLLAGCIPGLANTVQPATIPGLAGSTATATFPPATKVEAPATSLPTRSALPACVVRPEVTEGPYFVDEGLNRSDVRSEPSNGKVKEGAPLTLGFNVSQIDANGCVPLEGARVEIWHCDADGVYSDVSDPRVNTKGQKFLRGYQLTDGNGQATFQTIYPGWYPGRTVHIHFKIIQASSRRSAVFTSQLFFDDAFTNRVFTAQPYASRGQRDTLNDRDGIYKDQLLLNVKESDAEVAGIFEVGLQVG